MAYWPNRLYKNPKNPGVLPFQKNPRVLILQRAGLTCVKPLDDCLAYDNCPVKTKTQEMLGFNFESNLQASWFF